MEVLYPCCCGLDVHKKSITACVLWAEPKGKKRQQKRVFTTFTQDLLALADWLRECGVTHVALESTGVYWKPVWNVLEGQFEVLLVNAQHIKAVPGRKTDQKDSEWIADLLQHGLQRGSFVPPRETREMRDLTRYRVSITEECNRIANRIQKVLEDANVKLASVATDALGASGRAMLEAILAGEQDAGKTGRLIERATPKQDSRFATGAGGPGHRAPSLYAAAANGRSAACKVENGSCRSGDRSQNAPFPGGGHTAEDDSGSGPGDRLGPAG